VTQEYCPRIDGARSYEVALEAARADYLANRREGETARQYVERRKAERGRGSCES
jgi:hypothetical protein